MNEKQGIAWEYKRVRVYVTRRYSITKQTFIKEGFIKQERQTARLSSLTRFFQNFIKGLKRMRINSIKETVNGIKFDSQLEAEAYRLLTALYTPRSVVCQYPVILDYCHDGKSIQSIKHRVDFGIVDKEGNLEKLIEIKGILRGRWHGRAEYAMILNLFRASQPELFKIYQVWVADSCTSFFTGKELPFVKRFPFQGVSQARLYLSSKGII